MKISKYDLCSSCRQIQYLDDITLGGYLDGSGYNAPNLMALIMGNQLILHHLESKGGCKICINFVKRAIQIQTETGVFKTPPDVFTAIRKKAESNDVEAMLNLYGKLCFAYGMEKNEDYNTEANHWIEKAANLGNAEAQCELSDVYRTERNNESEAFKWLEKSAFNGFTRAKHNLAAYFFSLQNYEQSFRWMEQASKDGHVGATRKLGLFYFNGIGVSVDQEKGVSLLKEAATLGDDEAKNILEQN